MFRPCIDLHEGKVKQIVGGTLSGEPGALRTNFVSERPASWFAELYRKDGLAGGHVIMLGPGSESEARSALAAWPGGMQIGGGINASNAAEWLEAGASHVIVTSWVFSNGRLNRERLGELAKKIGRERLVLDLSCRKIGSDYVVMTERWQNPTQLKVGPDTLQELSKSCAEFLVHAVDVEGLCLGVDMELVRLLADASPLPATYAGGARTLNDLEEVTRAGQGRVHLTIGSALDIFGGTGVKYEEVVAFNRRQKSAAP
jgi:phosphoribosylformimino-5-aminoimidazole carboxamide ribotide isomerase